MKIQTSNVIYRNIPHFKMSSSKCRMYVQQLARMITENASTLHIIGSFVMGIHWWPMVLSPRYNNAGNVSLPWWRPPVREPCEWRPQSLRSKGGQTEHDGPEVKLTWLIRRSHKATANTLPNFLTTRKEIAKAADELQNDCECCLRYYHH